MHNKNHISVFTYYLFDLLLHYSHIMHKQLLEVKVLEVKVDFDNSGRFDTCP